MNLGRSDTYINVYLPREDGEIPRRYAKPISPVFSGDEIYKFSEQIVKDRKLFIGRKQTSLYEIYYKDGKDGGEHSVESVDNADESEDAYHECNTGSSKENKDGFQYHTPKISKVSISLRRAEKGKAPRFNEPISLYGMNKGHSTTKYEPAASLERPTFDIVRNAKRRRATTGNKNNTSTSKTYNISKLFKKLQSAPPEVRSLGLPPISRSHTAMTALQPDFSHDSQRTFISTRSQPVRPSSKLTKIWKQSTNAYVRGYTPKTVIEHSTKSGHMTSAGTRLTASLTGVGFV